MTNNSSAIEGPTFFWTLRDFYLDIYENFESSNAYMEDCLKPALDVDPETLKKNAIRKSIVNFFKRRNCYPLIRPVTEEDDLANIENLEWTDLKEEFRTKCDQFINDVRYQTKPKTLSGKVLNSQMLLGLVMDYCEAVNSDETPKVESSVMRLVAEETRVIQDDAFYELKTVLDDEIGVEPVNQD